ncbi:MAG TPA: response regulator transcription factor [Chitinophagaceae bacterium]|nr:response regulator transcription factor [Chitinophagaceae bacterium]
MSKTITVALCEDNDYFRESLHQFIDDSPGYEVLFSLSSAENILDRLTAIQPQVILMDIDMPSLNGIKATSLVKSHFPGIDVLILTVYDDDEKIFDAILSGASGYLLKKTPPGRILEAIAEIRDGGASMNASIVKKVLTFFNRQPVSTPSNDYTLSQKETAILQCLVNGDSYKMIADHCNISIGTVRSHINNIYKKLHINSKSEAVAKALKEKLLP